MRAIAAVGAQGLALPVQHLAKPVRASLLGLLIWVSVAYPQISFATNKGCGFMANPSWSVNAFAKHIALHLYQYPVAVKWGGNKNINSLVLAQPTIKPFTAGAKEYGLHFAADAAAPPCSG